MSGIPEIDPQTLALRLGPANPPLVLDVREPWELEIAALPNSLTIPLGTIPRRVDDIPHDRPIAVLCHHGARSAQATVWLLTHGFADVVNIGGGIDAWSRLVDPAVPRY